MRYSTYIDESGNTGDNLIDRSQKIFTLAAVTIPECLLEEKRELIAVLFDALKENGETELKASSWIRASKRANALRQIIQSLLDSCCDLSYILIEKRFMVAALIVDNFLDGAYNDNEDYTWCNDNDEKKRAAQYFYEVLSDEEIDAIEPAFTEPSIDKARYAMNIVIAKTKDPIYQAMLKGCHLEELVTDDIKAVLSNKDAKSSVVRSPNYSAFVALGLKVSNFCKSNSIKSNIVFDSCNLCNEAYKNIYDRFQIISYNRTLEVWGGLFSWAGIIDGFEVKDSKADILLQAADILATSVNKSLEKLFADQPLNEFNMWMIHVINILNDGGRTSYVMNRGYFEKFINYRQQ